MIFFDCTRLYDLGLTLQGIKEITGKTLHHEAFLKSYHARKTLLDFLQDESYKDSIKIMQGPADKLEVVLKRVFSSRTEENDQEKIGMRLYIDLRNATQEFEHVLKAEIRNWNTFIATPVAAYDVKILINHGVKIFDHTPFESLFEDAADDIKAGARCLAFNLYTASGFHFHRANESVILCYMKHLDIDLSQLDRNMGAYIEAIQKAGAPQEVIACLRDLKNLKRNPLMHPEDSIEELDEAISLLNHIHAAIVAIMKQMK